MRPAKMAPEWLRLAASAAKSITIHILIISFSSPSLIAPTTTTTTSAATASSDLSRAARFRQDRPAAAAPTLNDTLTRFAVARTADGGQNEEEELERFRRRVSRSSSPTGKTPEFAGAIGNVSAVLGRDVRLVCTVENLGQHQVAWLKEETKTILSIDTNIIITNYRIFLIPDDEGRKWVLHIKDVQESDRGAYQCQINTNPKRSISGYLDVVVPPKLIEAESTQVVEVMENSNVSLQCKASGHPKPSIGWRREDGEPIKLAGNVGGGTASNQDEQPRTSGGNHSSDKSGSTIRVNQRGPASSQWLGPSIDQQMTTTTTTTTHLSDVRSDRLFLTNVDRTMAGLYICTASNGIMSPVSRQIPLYVKFVPKVSIPVRAISANLGDQLDIDCLIEAFPKPTSHWSERQFIEPLPPAQAQMLDDHHRSTSGNSLRSQRFDTPAYNKWYRGRKFLVAEALTLATNASSIVASSSSLRPAMATANATTTTNDTRDADSERQVHRRQAGDHPTWLALSSAPSEHSGDEGNSLETDTSSQRQTVSSSGDTDARRIPTRQSKVTLSAGPGGKETKGFLVGKHHKSNKASVTVRQTALNPYTYKLQISIPEMRQNDFGEYVCTSSNSMGTSTAWVLVKRAEQVRTPAAEAVESNIARSYSLTELAADSQVGYQRDSMSLGGLSLQPVPGANHYIQAQKPYRMTQLDDRPPPTWPSNSRHNNRVVYDENYLQSIRNRQSISGYPLSSAAIGNEQRSGGTSDGLARCNLDMVWLLVAWTMMDAVMILFRQAW